MSKRAAIYTAVLASTIFLAPACNANEVNAQAKPNEKIQKLHTEEQEIEALYKKIEAETKLQEVILKQKCVDKAAQAWAEAEMAKAANQKAQWEKCEAEAKAATLECQLREVKAKTDLALNSSYQASTLAAYKASIAENELKLARLQFEKEKLNKL